MRKDKELTEAEWLAGEDPVRMIDFLIARARSRREALPHRKLRLFGCGLCRRFWPFFADERSRQAVETAERYADGLATRSALLRDCRDAHRALTAQRGVGKGKRDAFLAAAIAVWASEDSIQDVSGTAGYAEQLAVRRSGATKAADKKAARAGEVRRQCGLLRDLFGNPFRAPPAVEPGWLAWGGGTVTNLAQAIYDEHIFDRLPVLADALEEAGCAEAELLGHCRRPGEHARGCWLIDAVLGNG